jgi:hypothetical protein
MPSLRGDKHHPGDRRDMIHDAQWTLEIGADSETDINCLIFY